MTRARRWIEAAALALAAVLLAWISGYHVDSARAQQPTAPAADVPPVAPPAPPAVETFEQIYQRRMAVKDATRERHMAYLNQRYDLSNRHVQGVTMTRGTPVQGGIRVRLRQGLTWEQLANTPIAAIRDQGLWPPGFMPLPHPDHPEGGMLFPKRHIDEVKRQEGRDLARFDLDFDIPEHMLAEFPPAIFLSTRPELGDVSKGELVTIDNFQRLFKDILNPKQIEGLRLLVTPFPQQQFNATDDRRSMKPHQGVACFDCHINGHTSGATHLVGDIRPQEFRHRIETPSLRGVNIQRLFGSQRALKSVEDFTEFEQRAAYFDGDPVAATKKGANILERGSQVHFMGEFQNLLDFPAAPKLDLYGKLDPTQASEQELRGQELFFGKAQCAVCHPAPYYTDGSMHDLMTQRFFTPQTVLGHTFVGDGKIKTFPLRGIKDSPPYLHDGRLMTLEDTVEFFNMVLGTKLTTAEKADLTAFLRCL